MTEPPSRRAPGTLFVTDLAYDRQREFVYIGTCCEPGSGHLWRVETQRPAAGLLQDDQGFSIDVGGSPPVSARTDTWGTLLFRMAAGTAANLREGSGVADVAVDGAGMIIALIDSRRLRSVVPTAPQPADTAHDPGLLVIQRQASGAWRDIKYALPRDRTYCRIVPLHDGTIGLLAGSLDQHNPIQCTGDTLDVYDTTRRTLRAAVLEFPQALRHLSIDDTSRFLLFTTVGGAVGWRTLEGEGKLLAPSGFVAADW